MIRHCVKSVCIRSYSDPYFSAFWLNTEKYSVSFCIQSKYGKIWNRITPNTDAFHAVRVKVQFVEWISRDGQIKNFFYMRRGRKLFVGKMYRSIKQLYKKFSLFCFCKFLCLVHLRICFCLNRAKSWLELSIKFNRCSMRSFQRAL